MTQSPNAPLPFDQLAKAIEARRSVYGYISGLRLDRSAPGEAWSSLPYRPVFVGDTATGVLHGGVVTAMLDESCGMAVQLALDGTRSIATLDLRIDYHKPATPGLDIKAHSVCHRVTRSIAFVRSAAYQESEDDPVATATACFMVGANRTNMLTDERMWKLLRRVRGFGIDTVRGDIVLGNLEGTLSTGPGSKCGAGSTNARSANSACGADAFMSVNRCGTIAAC